MKTTNRHLFTCLLATPIFVLPLISRAQYAPPTSGLVSWWRGEGNANDSWDSNPGTALNGVVYASGKIGSGFSFNGTGAHVRISDSANLRLTSSFTLSAWVNPANYNNYHEIISKWGAVFPVNHNGYTFSISPDGRSYVGISADGTDTGANVFTTSTIALNTWTHLAGTYDGSKLRIYVNGVLNNETTYSGGIFATTDDLSIGGVVGKAAIGNGLSFFAGGIDEVMIYNRALSGTEVVALTAVPEPATIALIMAGMLTFFAQRRRIP